jgi:hypothetical protein
MFLIVFVIVHIALIIVMDSASCMILVISDTKLSKNYFGCMSKKVLNVNDLAYTILYSLTSSITLSRRLFTKFLKLRSKIFVSFLSDPCKWFSYGWLMICQNKPNLIIYVKSISEAILYIYSKYGSKSFMHTYFLHKYVRG